MSATFEHGHLSLAGQDIESIPSDLANKYPATTTLDLSYNAIQSITGLEGFSRIDHIILDNNHLTSPISFPSLPRVHTLCVNNNQIEDLDQFITNIQDNLPNLTYLSMLKNPACPNFFMGKRDEEYNRYRYSVLHRLPNLKFLDSTPVTDNERKEAQRIGHLLKVARPSAEQYTRTSERKDDGIRELPPSERKVGQTRASMGVARYVYQGRQSEGNRFISNNDL